MLRSSREAVDGFLRTAFVSRDRYTADRGEMTAEVRSIEVRVSREPKTVSSLLVVVLRSGKRDRFVVERQESAASLKNKTIKKVGIYFPKPSFAGIKTVFSRNSDLLLTAYLITTKTIAIQSAAWRRVHRAVRKPNLPPAGD